MTSTEEPLTLSPFYDLHQHLEENLINNPQTYLIPPNFNQQPKVQQQQQQQQRPQKQQQQKPLPNNKKKPTMEIEKSKNQSKKNNPDEISEEGFEHESLEFSEEEKDDSDNEDGDDDDDEGENDEDNEQEIEETQNHEERKPNANNMVLEDDGDCSFKGGSLKLGDTGNYEIVELDDDSFDKIGSNEETFLQMNSILEEMNANRVFKKIGSQVYEYEEL